MLSFVNDYSEGAHEQVLRRLAETNREQHPGYGTDPYCARAKEKIRRACGCPEGDVFFPGGRDPDQSGGDLRPAGPLGGGDRPRHGTHLYP